MLTVNESPQWNTGEYDLIQTLSKYNHWVPKCDCLCWKAAWHRAPPLPTLPFFPPPLLQCSLNLRLECFYSLYWPLSFLCSPFINFLLLGSTKELMKGKGFCHERAWESVCQDFWKSVSSDITATSFRFLKPMFIDLLICVCECICSSKVHSLTVTLTYVSLFLIFNDFDTLTNY